jgi:uroporphyrinogen decarboxylase
MSLTHRERVIMALSHEYPDRLPIDMMGNATMLLDKTYLRLRDHLGLAPIPPVRSGTSANYYDERILEHFGVDFRRIFLKSGSNNQTTRHEDGSFTDAWGVRSIEAGIFVNAVEHPLSHAASIDDVDAYPWPTAENSTAPTGWPTKPEGYTKRPTTHWWPATLFHQASWTEAVHWSAWLSL